MSGTKGWGGDSGYCIPKGQWTHHMNGWFRLRLGEVGQRDSEELMLWRGRGGCREGQAGAGGHDVDGSRPDWSSEEQRDRAGQHGAGHVTRVVWRSWLEWMPCCRVEPLCHAPLSCVRLSCLAPLIGQHALFQQVHQCRPPSRPNLFLGEAQTQDQGRRSAPASNHPDGDRPPASAHPRLW